MKKEALNTFIRTNHPNICQVVAYRDGKEVYSNEWNH